MKYEKPEVFTYGEDRDIGITAGGIWVSCQGTYTCSISPCVNTVYIDSGVICQD